MLSTNIISLLIWQTVSQSSQIVIQITQIIFSLKLISENSIHITDVCRFIVCSYICTLMHIASDIYMTTNGYTYIYTRTVHRQAHTTIIVYKYTYCIL